MTRLTFLTHHSRMTGPGRVRAIWSIWIRTNVPWAAPPTKKEPAATSSKITTT